MSGVRFKVSHVECHLSPVTCHRSIMSTATTTNCPLLTPPNSTISCNDTPKKCAAFFFTISEQNFNFKWLIFLWWNIPPIRETCNLLMYNPGVSFEVYMSSVTCCMSQVNNANSHSPGLYPANPPPPPTQQGVAMTHKSKIKLCSIFLPFLSQNFNFRDQPHFKHFLLQLIDFTFSLCMWDITKLVKI